MQFIGESLESMIFDQNLTESSNLCNLLEVFNNYPCHFPHLDPMLAQNPPIYAIYWWILRFMAGIVGSAAGPQTLQFM